MLKPLIRCGLALVILTCAGAHFFQGSLFNPDTAFAQSSGSNKIVDPAHPEKGPQDPEKVQIDYSKEPIGGSRSLSFTHIAISIGLGLSAGFGWYWFYKNRSD